jgi:hypothetical protein
VFSLASWSPIASMVGRLNWSPNAGGGADRHLSAEDVRRDLSVDPSGLASEGP